MGGAPNALFRRGFTKDSLPAGSEIIVEGIRMPLYRRAEKDAQLMEFKCVPFSGELLYGHLRRKPSQ